jgi:hypothetical protein
VQLLVDVDAVGLPEVAAVLAEVPQGDVPAEGRNCEGRKTQIFSSRESST